MATSENARTSNTTGFSMEPQARPRVELYCFRGNEAVLYGSCDKKKLLAFCGVARIEIRSKGMVNPTIPPGSIELPRRLAGKKDVVESVCAWVDSQNLHQKTPMTMGTIQAANPQKTISSSITNMILLYGVGHDLGISKEHRGDSLRDGIQAHIKSQILTPAQFQLIMESLRFDETTTRKTLEESIIKYSKGSSKRDPQLATDYETIKAYCRTHQLGQMLNAIEQQVKNDKKARSEHFKQLRIEAAKEARRLERKAVNRATLEERNPRRTARIGGDGGFVEKKDDFPPLR